MLNFIMWKWKLIKEDITLGFTTLKRKRIKDIDRREIHFNKKWILKFLI